MDKTSKILALVMFVVFVGVVSFSYYRFFVAHDYTVTFEAECDPVSESCFVGCEEEVDGVCKSEYTYVIVERNAGPLFAACGSDATDCAEARICPEEDATCHLHFCSAESLRGGRSCAIPPEELESEDQSVAEPDKDLISI